MLIPKYSETNILLQCLAVTAILYSIHKYNVKCFAGMLTWLRNQAGHSYIKYKIALLKCRAGGTISLGIPKNREEILSCNA
jgi:hypothetical protein